MISAKKITRRTRAIVLINPNNPTGAVYSKDLLQQVIELAREHNLIILSDEIYDKILYDGTQHTSIASLADDVLFFTYNGLSKNYRAAGYRSGWMIISGAKHKASDLIEGIEMLSNMRLCANVPAQLAIQTSLGGYQSINDLVAPGGRLYEQRETAWRMLNDIPGVSCVKPRVRFTCSLGSIPSSSRWRTMRSWFWTCCSRRKYFWFRAQPSTLMTNNTCELFSCPG